MHQKPLPGNNKCRSNQKHVLQEGREKKDPVIAAFFRLKTSEDVGLVNSQLRQKLTTKCDTKKSD